MLNDNNFSQMASAESIYIKRNKQCQKNCNYFYFTLWNLFSPCSFKKGTIYCKVFSSKITSKSCNKGLLYCKFNRKESKILYENGNSIKGNITTKYIKYSHKNTGTRGKSIPTSGLQCFNSSIKCWKPVLLKPSFDLSVEIRSQFSRLVCFNWEHK